MGSGGSVPSATASGPPRGEASASNVSRPRVRVIMRHLRPGETIARGVGEVAGADAPPVGAEHPSTEALTSEEHGWFVEDLEHFGQWEAYNEESTQRLEQAFLSQAEQCTVVMKKRTHVVSFATMQQLPSASSTATGAKALPTRPRAVRRAPVEVATDPVTGVPTRRMKSSGVVDPFDQEDDPSTVEALAEGAEGESRVGETIISEVPALHCSLIVGSQPLYCMDLAPQCVSTPNGAVSMVVGSKEGTLLELSIDGLSSAISASYASKSPQNSTLSVLTAVYSASGQYIVSGGDDRIARLYRCGKSEPLQLLKGHQHKVYGAAVMLGDRKVVTGSMDATVCTWDVETGNCEISEHCHNSHVFAVKLSSVSPFLGLSAGDDMLLCLHDFRRPMSVVQRFRGHRKTIWDCDIRGDDGAFVSCGMDQTVRVWDPRISEKEMICMQQHYRPVHCARFTPKGTGVLSSAKDGYAYLSNAETGETVWRTKVHGATAYRALYSAKAKTLLTCSSDSSINAWKWDTKENW